MSHNLNHITGIALTATMLMASCASEPLSGPDTGELYTRQFIKDFGVPAAGHDYSMARSAGLQLSTKVGGRVAVTAMVHGKEYLFADLNLTPGTQSIPITIPKSVTEVMIRTDRGIITAGPDDTVDIDGKDPESRSGNWLLGFDLENAYGVGQNVYLPLGIAEQEGDAPEIIIRPESFLKQYFEKYPVGKEDTNFSYEGENEGDGSIIFNENTQFPTHAGETLIGDGAENASYYVFPIWWHASGKDKSEKNYRVTISETDDAYLQGLYMLDFGQDFSNPNIPFPNLGYSTEDLDEHTIKNGAMYDEVKNSFRYDDGSFTQAYDVNEAQMIISRGIKLEFLSYSPGVEPLSSIVFGLYSGNNWSHRRFSTPRYNMMMWDNGANYFDVPISNLFMAYAATSQTIIEDEFKYYHLNFNKGATTYQDGSHIKGTNWFLLGFNSAPGKPADRTPRDYADVLLLVIPTKQINHWYHYWDLPQPMEWTIAAEDLGGSLDWDFNDAVFSFSDIVQSLNLVNKNRNVSYMAGPRDAEAVRVITVTPRASGGTLPLYITYTGANLCTMPYMPTEGTEWYSDVNNAIREHIAKANRMSGTFVLGTELHKWLGASTHTSPLNAGSNRRDHGAEPVQFVLPTNNEIGDEVTYPASTSGENTTIAGFALLVDKDNTLQIDARNDEERGIRHMPEHTLGQGTYLVGAPNPAKHLSAPQMILVDIDWEWPQETTDIRLAYPDFVKWISDPTNSTDWHQNQNSDKVTRK